jgi:hypothetical protein
MDEDLDLLQGDQDLLGASELDVSSEDHTIPPELEGKVSQEQWNGFMDSIYAAQEFQQENVEPLLEGWADVSQGVGTGQTSTGPIWFDSLAPEVQETLLAQNPDAGFEWDAQQQENWGDALAYGEASAQYADMVNQAFNEFGIPRAVERDGRIFFLNFGEGPSGSYARLYGNDAWGADFGEDAAIGTYSVGHRNNDEVGFDPLTAISTVALTSMLGPVVGSLAGVGPGTANAIARTVVQGIAEGGIDPSNALGIALSSVLPPEAQAAFEAGEIDQEILDAAVGEISNVLLGDGLDEGTVVLGDPGLTVPSDVISPETIQPPPLLPDLEEPTEDAGGGGGGDPMNENPEESDQPLQQPSDGVDSGGEITEAPPFWQVENGNVFIINPQTGELEAPQNPNTTLESLCEIYGICDDGVYGEHGERIGEQETPQGPIAEEEQDDVVSLPFPDFPEITNDTWVPVFGGPSYDEWLEATGNTSGGTTPDGGTSTEGVDTTPDGGTSEGGTGGGEGTGDGSGSGTGSGTGTGSGAGSGDGSGTGDGSGDGDGGLETPEGMLGGQNDFQPFQASMSYNPQIIRPFPIAPRTNALQELTMLTQRLRQR